MIQTELSDDKFKQVIGEVRNVELAKLPESSKLDHTFSDRYRKNTKNLYKRYRHKAFMKKLPRHAKRVAVILAIILAGAFTTVMSVDALREKFFNMFTQTQTTYTDFWFEPTWGKPIKFHQFFPQTISYVPKGFELEDTKQLTSTQRHTTYSNDKGKRITIMQYHINVNHVMFDTENARLKDTMIQGYPATLWSKNGQNMILFVSDYYFFTIHSELNWKELIKMAESIPLEQPEDMKNTPEYELTDLPEDMIVYNYTKDERKNESTVTYRVGGSVELPHIALSQVQQETYDAITVDYAQPEPITINGDPATLWYRDGTVTIAFKKDGRYFRLSTDMDRDLAIAAAESLQKTDS